MTKVYENTVGEGSVPYESDYESASENDYEVLEAKRVKNLQTQCSKLETQNKMLKSLLHDALLNLQMVIVDPAEIITPSTSCDIALSKTCNTIVENIQKQYLSATEIHEKPLLCNLCCSKERSIAFLPCFHSVACRECSKQCVDCPICRERIKDSLNIYLN